MESLLKYIKTQLEEAEKALKDAEESLRLANLMGVDVSEAQLRFEQAKKRYMQLKAGFERYLGERGIRV